MSQPLSRGEVSLRILLLSILIVPSLRRLLSHVKTLVRTRDYVHEPLDNWFDGDGRMLIVGQAAHASSVRLNLLTAALHPLIFYFSLLVITLQHSALRMPSF